MKVVRHFSTLALAMAFLAGGVPLAHADDTVVNEDNGSMAMQKDDAMAMHKGDGMKKDAMMKGDDHMAKKDDMMMRGDSMSKDKMAPTSDRGDK